MPIKPYFTRTLYLDELARRYRVRCYAIRSSRRSIAIVVTFSLCVFVATAGCRTAGSLGLPVSPGLNYMLPGVAHLRKEAGHRDDVPTELAKSALPTHRLEAGDTIIVEANDFSSPVRMPGDLTVSRDGTVDLGQYGKFIVAGLTIDEVQQHVQQAVYHTETQKREARIALASHRNDEIDDEPVDLGVTVRLSNEESVLIYVMGEVNAPGSYPLTGHETVLDALIAAGGLADRANDHQIILTRPQREGQPRVILPVCYQNILQLGDVATNYQLMPGDRIYVPSMSLSEDIRLSLPGALGKSCPHCQKYR